MVAPNYYLVFLHPLERQRPVQLEIRTPFGSREWGREVGVAILAREWSSACLHFITIIVTIGLTMHGFSVIQMSVYLENRLLNSAVCLLPEEWNGKAGV